MDWLLYAPDGKFIGLLLIGLAILLVLDSIASDLGKAEKGGDGGSNEQPSPPDDGRDWRV